MKKLPVQGYEGAYEVSNEGEVYSLARTVLGVDGTVYPFKAKKKVKNTNTQTGYFTVSLYKNNQSILQYVHRIVAEAFIPNPENKKEVNHIDGDRQNNNVSNLEWNTRSENAQHAVRTGLKIYTNRLTKDEFLECLQAIIGGESYLSLSKRVPYQVPFLSVKLRRIAKERGIEYLLDESLKEQKQRRARINGSRNNSF